MGISYRISSFDYEFSSKQTQLITCMTVKSPTTHKKKKKINDRPATRLAIDTARSAEHAVLSWLPAMSG